MDISWDDAKLFLAIAETGSLSAAARRLKLGQPTVTRRLALLEYTVGAALFRRSVEGASLTSAGERLVTPAKKMAEWAGELHRAAEKQDGTPRGLVRITASPSLCFDFLAPFAGFLATKHPGLRLEVSSAVQYVDLVRGDADLALRPVAPSNPDLVLVHTVNTEAAVFVSRALKDRLPKKFDLQTLPWVAWSPPFDSVPPNPQLAAAIPDFVPAFTADHYLVQLAAAEAGVGAILLSRSFHRFKRESSLVPLDLDLGRWTKQPLHLVCAKSALDIPRVRKVAELLVKELTSKR
ncbi:MAG: LysR family transcriptional regulator [Archangium gephyra]|uniref:LysR family transcriptional regulator n=1 Tax=Archangium gephyra TaxID=48 RepID=A0A2W5TG06_9BACT|nr:MAG: LysR family transcriptional regulator [Archangium gephyra]